jgi:hypothetical protein
MNKALSLPGSHASEILSSEMCDIARSLLQRSMRIASVELQPVLQRDCQCNVSVLSSSNFNDITSTVDRVSGTLPLSLPHDDSNIALLFLSTCTEFPHVFALNALQMNSIHKSLKECDWKDGKASVHVDAGVHICLHRRAVCFDRESSSSFDSVLQYGEHLPEHELRQHLKDITRAASGMSMQPYIVDVEIKRQHAPTCIRIVCTTKAFACKHMQLSVVGMPSNSDDYNSCKKINLFKTKNEQMRRGCMREADMLTQCAPLLYQHTTALQHLLQQASTHTCAHSGMHEATLLNNPSILQASHVHTFGQDLKLLSVSNTWMRHRECRTPISIITCSFRMLDAQGSPHSVRVAVSSLVA